MEHWYCVDCESRVPITQKKCPSCGYEMTEYDLAGAAEDTGEYLVNELNLPEPKLEVKLSSLKVVIAAVIGIGVGSAVIAAIKYLM